MNLQFQNQMDIHEFLILNIRETLTQKRIKKALFIVISIIYPLLEIIYTIFQTKYSFKFDDDLDFVSASKIFYGLFALGSLFCTWGMVSVCYLENVCLRTLLLFKIFFIIITFLVMTAGDNDKFYELLVYGILFFGSFITLIIVYKVFPKGII